MYMYARMCSNKIVLFGNKYFIHKMMEKCQINKFKWFNSKHAIF